MEESRRDAILRMAESFLWRAEVSSLQVYAVVRVLEALGYLNDVTCAHIEDDIKEIFGETKEDDECHWIRDDEVSNFNPYCKKDHACGNSLPEILEMNKPQSNQQALL